MSVTATGGAGTVNFTSLTVYQNCALNAGGGLMLLLNLVANSTATAAFDNNILDGNSVVNDEYNGGQDVTYYSRAPFGWQGTFTDKGYNLVGTSDTMFSTTNHDILDNTTGLASSLAANGAKSGYPETLALSTTSPGYETGYQTLAGQIDERGLTRQANKVSIGAEDPDAM